MTKENNHNQCEAIDDALQSWRQGDCALGDHWFVHRFSPDAPLTNAAAEIAGDGVDLAESQVRGFMIVSQSCDVVRPCADRPYVEVAPLVEVDPKELKDIEAGRRPRYVFIPRLEGTNLVGDLDRVMTVEKPVIRSWTRTEGCSTDQAKRRLAQALSRQRNRFAFPDEFTEFARQLQSRLREKHGKNSDEGEALRALREIRVRAAPSWDSDPVEIMFWFIRHADESDFKGKSWDSQLKRWLNLVPESGRFRPIHGLVVTLEDLTAREYVESDPLDLDHLSSREG